MIVELTICKQGNSKDKDTTHHTFDEIPEDLVAWAKEHVSLLNKDKASFEKLYVLSGVKEYHHPDPTDPKVHDWENNSFKLVSGGKAYNLVRCSKCRITGTRYDDKVHVVLDRKYTAKYYNVCSDVIKNSAKKEKSR